MNSSGLTFGVIGCGHWGRNYVRVLQENKQTVAEVSDAARSNLDFIRSRYPLINGTPTYADLLKNPQIEAVVIATPAETHLEIASAALRSGKHVLLEKPLALSVEHCERITELAAKEKKALMVGHTFLYNDSVRKMKELARAPETGNIYYVVARRTHAGTIREDVNVMWDLAPHDLSILSYLLDEEPVWVSVVGGAFLKPPRLDVSFMTLGFPGGAIGSIQSSWVDSGKVREVVVIGSRRRVVFDDLNLMESVRVFEKGVSLRREHDSFGEFQYLLRDGDIFSPKVHHQEPLKNQCMHFVDCVTNGKKPLTDGESGTRVVRALEAAERSLAQEGRKIEISSGIGQ